jgi:hypothetical protein
MINMLVHSTAWSCLSGGTLQSHQSFSSAVLLAAAMSRAQPFAVFVLQCGPAMLSCNDVLLCCPANCRVNTTTPCQAVAVHAAAGRCGLLSRLAWIRQPCIWCEQCCAVQQCHASTSVSTSKCSAAVMPVYLPALASCTSAHS